MEFNIGNGVSIVLPPLHITILAIIIIILLARWSKQLETQRFKVYLYFLISIYSGPIYSHSTLNGNFELWIPLGFIVVAIYLYGSKRFHPSKLKASVLGLCVALYQIIVHYIG